MSSNSNRNKNSTRNTNSSSNQSKGNSMGKTDTQIGSSSFVNHTSTTPEQGRPRAQRLVPDGRASATDRTRTQEAKPCMLGGSVSLLYQTYFAGTQTLGQTDKQTHRQTHTHTYTHIYTYRSIVSHMHACKKTCRQTYLDLFSQLLVASCTNRSNLGGHWTCRTLTSSDDLIVLFPVLDCSIIAK